MYNVKMYNTKGEFIGTLDELCNETFNKMFGDVLKMTDDLDFVKKGKRP